MATTKKIKMTLEIAAQLRGLLPISADARQRFTPSAFLKGSIPAEFIPVFVIRSMTKTERQDYSKSFNDNPEKSFNACIFGCIESVENLYDPYTGEICQFDLEHFETMQPEIRNEITEEVMVASCLLSCEALGLK